MNLNPFFKSLLEQDKDPIVICDLEHTVIYMNPTAISQYANRGGAGLIGRSLLDCHNEKSCDLINQTIAWFSRSTDNNIVHTSYNAAKSRDTYMIALRDEDKTLIGYYEKHLYRTPDTEPFYNFK